ncbi:MAG: thioesterase family protein [Pseudomonadota bacterium]
MNLYLRLIWALFRTRFMPSLSIDDTLERTFRVWPNDLDINVHMNNGRYLTMLDLLLVEYFARIGFLRVLMQNNWRPMSGGACITYRRGLKPFQKYRIRYSWAGSNEFWNVMKFEFLTMDGELCATGFMKGAAVGSRGLVPNAKSFEKLGVTQMNRDLPEAARLWLQAEEAMMDNRADLSLATAA